MSDFANNKDKEKLILTAYKKLKTAKENMQIKFEWQRLGDNFKKLTIYNKVYQIIPTLEGKTNLSKLK